MKYSLFLLEEIRSGNYYRTDCCLHLETFDTIEEARLAQKEFELRTIIISTW